MICLPGSAAHQPLRQGVAAHALALALTSLEVITQCERPERPLLPAPSCRGSLQSRLEPGPCRLRAYDGRRQPIGHRGLVAQARLLLVQLPYGSREGGRNLTGSPIPEPSTSDRTH